MRHNFETHDSTIDNLIASLDDHHNPTTRDASRAKLEYWLSLPYGLRTDQRERIEKTLAE